MADADGLDLIAYQPWRALGVTQRTIDLSSLDLLLLRRTLEA